MARNLIQYDDKPNTDEEDVDPVANDSPRTTFLPNTQFDRLYVSRFSVYLISAHLTVRNESSNATLPLYRGSFGQPSAFCQHAGALYSTGMSAVSSTPSWRNNLRSSAPMLLVFYFWAVVAPEGTITNSNNTVRGQVHDLTIFENDYLEFYETMPGPRTVDDDLLLMETLPIDSALMLFDLTILMP
ncbi:hypothetical protein BGZ97_008433 [Linnemannia gamsii]|uniref:Uncharacterized protein n=1 Tax=Linnemannia gamsii TaxID=64522 RepID=A0A9P6QPG1_9FUNG|nr:hypothetical protein BGZ97_008433 [Linnemannia gamsii]